MYKLYKIVNSINGTVYIGITKTTVDKIFAQHIKDSQNPKYPLHQAIKKYGIECFDIEPLLESPSCDIISAVEEPTIIKFNSQDHRYNVATGGYGSDLGNFAKHIKGKQNVI
jgi:hypothetical protein